MGKLTPPPVIVRINSGEAVVTLNQALAAQRAAVEAVRGFAGALKEIEPEKKPRVCSQCGARSMATHAHIVELNTNNTTMETNDIIPSKELQQRFAVALPRAIFSPLIKRHQPPKGVSVFIEPMTDIKPWPTEPAEEEPATPRVFRKTFSFKVTEKDKKAFKRMMRRECKIPRKLKKACRHIYLPYSKPTIHDVVKGPDGTISCVGFVSGYRIKPGYPHTKWARKAVAKINRNVQRHIQEVIKK